MNPAHLHILQHSIGVDKYGQGPHYRNHFVTGPGGQDFDHCQQLAAKGLMADRGPRESYGGMHLFIVTQEGKEAMTYNSPAPPTISRSKQNYQNFLRSDTGLTFIQWLRQTKKQQA